MAQTFHGPWSITIVNAFTENPNERFTIAGSNASDGLYYPGGANAALANVDGKGWTISIEAQIPAATLWLDVEEAKTAEYTTHSGLVVQLRTPDTNPLTTMVLVCRSLNPAHRPKPPGAPYEFTVSKEAMERYRRKAAAGATRRPARPRAGPPTRPSGDCGCGPAKPRRT